VTGTTEARTLFALLVALFALAVPAAATFPAASAAEVEKDPATHTAATLALLDNAPPPLIVMVIGLVIVAVTVLRRHRKSGLGSNADRS
jgi:hypothetical protein